MEKLILFSHPVHGNQILCWYIRVHTQFKIIICTYILHQKDEGKSRSTSIDPLGLQPAIYDLVPVWLWVFRTPYFFYPYLVCPQKHVFFLWPALIGYEHQKIKGKWVSSDIELNFEISLWSHLIILQTFHFIPYTLQVGMDESYIISIGCN